MLFLLVVRVENWVKSLYNIRNMHTVVVILLLRQGWRSCEIVRSAVLSVSVCE